MPTDRLRGRFEPLEVLGAGAQGEVWRARDHQHDRIVALKSRRLDGVGGRAAALAEARVLLDIRPHAGLPLVRDDFFTDDRHVIVMDFIDGVDLRTVLDGRDRRGLDYDEVLEIVERVAEALDHLHGHDPPVCHGDVKPANIVLGATGPVLVDLGLAWRGSGGLRGGTRAYLAPEVAAGGDPSPAADVYALAMTTYVLLTGGYPEPGRPPALESVPAGDRETVLRGLARGLAVEAARRPGAKAFVEGLRPAPAVESPSNLPVPPSELIGRAALVESVAERLRTRDVRLVTLTGPGGIGKTRAALEIAASVRNEFAHGAWLVELDAVADADGVGAAILRAVGAPERAGATVAEALEAWLRDREILLVLDNFEHVLDAAVLVAKLLSACPGLKVLATSREFLDLRAEHEVPVPVLAPDDAERLFRDRASRAGVDPSSLDRETVHSVCERFDGLPLAIELAAAALRRLPLGDIAEQLVLDVASRGPRDLPDRHRTLRNTVAWGHSLLPSDVRDAFDRLAVFRGGFPVEAAEQLGTSASHLDELADASLVTRVADGRYRLLETVRAFGWERLEDDGVLAACRDRHLEWVRDAAIAAAERGWGPDPPLASFARAEHANAGAALEWCAESDRTRDALRLVVELFHIWFADGHWSEGRRWLETFLDRTPSSGRLWAACSSQAGQLCVLLGDLRAAREWFVAAVDVWARNPPPDPELRARLRDADSRLGVAEATSWLSVVAQKEGDLDGARALATNAVEIRRALGSDAGVAASLAQLGGLQREAGAFADARATLEEAVERWRAVGYETSLALTLCSLGLVLRGLGADGDARAALTEALDLGVEAARPYCLLGLAGLGGEHAVDRAEAVVLAHEALASASESDDHVAAGEASRILAALALETGDLEGAGTRLEAACEDAARTADAPSHACDLASWAAVERLLGADGSSRARASWERWTDGHGLFPAPYMERLAAWLAAEGRHEPARRLVAAADADRLARGAPPLREDAPYRRIVLGGLGAGGAGAGDGGGASEILREIVGAELGPL